MIVYPLILMQWGYQFTDKRKSLLFRFVDTVFREMDILFGNLETVLSDDSEFSKKAAIDSSSGSIQWLGDAGFDIVNLSNNQIIDRIERGVVNTMNCPELAGIRHIDILCLINRQKYIQLLKKMK